MKTGSPTWHTPLTVMPIDRIRSRAIFASRIPLCAALLCAVAVAAAACGGSAGFADGGALQDPADAAALAGSDLAATGGSPDLATPLGSGDGSPMRQACTNALGSALSGTYGRIDGYLRAIVPPGGHSCSADSSHVHLQIEMSGAVYDVAVNTRDNKGADVLFVARDLALPDGAWHEGWHAQGVQLDYVAAGLHAGDFTATPENALVQTITTELQSANHLSVFMTGYGAQGGHKVHRNGGGQDGAIVINPLSPAPRLLMFHFANQSF